jgi:disease resistance protein RPM1
MGAINLLIAKITPLIENHPMIMDLLQDIKSLRDDLMTKFAGARSTGKQVKVWMKQSREMIYDIEDWIDLKQGVTNLGESDKKQIDQFKGQIKKARDRCERYELELLMEAPKSDAEPFYPGSSQVTRRRLFWEEKISLVGIDGPKADLLNHLKNEQEELMVLSIHGKEGHGKTALAKEIYGDIYIKAQFKCRAFVSAGHTTSMRTTLIEILRQVKFEEEEDWESWSYNEIITKLWQLLRAKRYLSWIYFLM